MSREPKPVIITFHIDGNPYAQREWYAVPRVGEAVLLLDHENSHRSALRPYTVKRIGWGQDDDTRTQLVHIDVEPEKP